ncbi:MAG: SAM-dependent methyltransferase [Bacteroidaceae bacterium]|nr:SAM-dependent methyltransferase [Bacteroidaceae bacterium]
METALYLIPVTLGATPFHQVIPAYNLDVIRQIRHFIVEEERTARRFLKMVDKSIDIDQLTFYPMGKHADPKQFQDYLRPLCNGEAMGIISEAGCPAIADPGADVVAIAQSLNLRVIPLVGPSSILLGLMASGFNGQSFAFHGYLPINDGQRSAMLKKLEARCSAEDQTQIFIETPFRNQQLFEDLLRICHPQTRLCVAAGITCEEEFIHTHTIQEWKKTTLPDLRKTPTIFLIYRPAAGEQRPSGRHRR